MSEQLFGTTVGFAVEDENTGIDTFQQFTVGGIPGDAGLSVADLALSNNAPIGSKATDNTTGFEYRKKTAGAGTATWVRTADQDDIIAAGGTESWREPAIVKDDTVYANTAAAEAAVNTGIIDGITLSANDRILFTAITGNNKNVFIVTGTPGAGATLVEDSNLATNNDAIIIDSGTFAGNQFNYNDVTASWVRSNQTSLDELGFIRAFIGKTAAGSELPAFTSNLFIANNDTLEVALGKLDAAIGTNAGNISTNATAIANIQGELNLFESSMGAVIDVTGAYVAFTTSNFIDGNTNLTDDLLALDAQVFANAQAIANISNDDSFQNTFMGKGATGLETPSYTTALVITQNVDLETAIGELDAHADRTNHEATASGITTLAGVDSVLVDDVKAVRWLIHVQQNTKIRTFEIDATHDGTAASDATDTDYTKYAKLKMNGGISGLKVRVDLTGAGVTQAMRLTVQANAAVEVSSSRLSVV